MPALVASASTEQLVAQRSPRLAEACARIGVAVEELDPSAVDWDLQLLTAGGVKESQSVSRVPQHAIDDATDRHGDMDRTSLGASCYFDASVHRAASEPVVNVSDNAIRTELLAARHGALEQRRQGMVRDAMREREHVLAGNDWSFLHPGQLKKGAASAGSLGALDASSTVVEQSKAEVSRALEASRARGMQIARRQIETQRESSKLAERQRVVERVRREKLGAHRARVAEGRALKAERSQGLVVRSQEREQRRVAAQKKELSSKIGRMEKAQEEGVRRRQERLLKQKYRSYVKVVQARGRKDRIESIRAEERDVLVSKSQIVEERDARVQSRFAAQGDTRRAKNARQRSAHLQKREHIAQVQDASILQQRQRVLVRQQDAEYRLAANASRKLAQEEQVRRVAERKRETMRLAIAKSAVVREEEAARALEAEAEGAARAAKTRLDLQRKAVIKREGTLLRKAVAQDRVQRNERAKQYWRQREEQRAEAKQERVDALRAEKASMLAVRMRTNHRDEESELQQAAMLETQAILDAVASGKLRPEDLKRRPTRPSTAPAASPQPQRKAKRPAFQLGGPALPATFGRGRPKSAAGVKLRPASAARLVRPSSASNIQISNRTYGYS